MNEKLNLVEILKDCPKGTRLYSVIHGNVFFSKIDKDQICPIVVKWDGTTVVFTPDGKLFPEHRGECTLFPSREQRDWYKFKTKNPKFDNKILSSIDKDLVRNSHNSIWHCDAFLNIRTKDYVYKFICVTDYYKYCIPYNEETKHLIGTNQQAPEYYRYWED